MNLNPVTILDNKESYNYNKADFSAMITFMRSINWNDGLCGKKCGEIMADDYKYSGPR